MNSIQDNFALVRQQGFLNNSHAFNVFTTFFNSYLTFRNIMLQSIYQFQKNCKPCLQIIGKTPLSSLTWLLTAALRMLRMWQDQDTTIELHTRITYWHIQVNTETGTSLVTTAPQIIMLKVQPTTATIPFSWDRSVFINIPRMKENL